MTTVNNDMGMKLISTFLFSPSLVSFMNFHIFGGYFCGCSYNGTTAFFLLSLLHSTVTYTAVPVHNIREGDCNGRFLFTIYIYLEIFLQSKLMETKFKCKQKFTQVPPPLIAQSGSVSPTGPGSPANERQA